MKTIYNNNKKIEINRDLNICFIKINVICHKRLNIIVAGAIESKSKTARIEVAREGCLLRN